MQALGFIETKGLLAAIESADAMLKAANVSMYDRTFTGGGLVAVTVIGDVGAVKAAVDAGAAAVMNLGQELLISVHVIPRPHDEVDAMMRAGKTLGNNGGGDDNGGGGGNASPAETPCEEENAEEITSQEAEEVSEEAEQPEAEEKPIGETQPETEIHEAENDEDADAENADSADTEEESDEDELDSGSLTKGYVDGVKAVQGIEKAVEILQKCKVVKLRNLARDYEGFGIAGREVSKANKAELIEEFKKYYSEN